MAGARRVIPGRPRTDAPAPHHLTRLTPEAIARLRGLIDQSGMTAARVAEAAGCPVSCLDALLDGSREWIHPDVLRDIARALRTFPSAILTGHLDTDASLAHRVITLRRERGLSQNTLAKSMLQLNGVGVHPAQIRRWERGTSRPNEENLTLLARALGVSTNYLRYGAEVPPPPTAASHAGAAPAGSARLRATRRALVFVGLGVACAFALYRVTAAPEATAVDPGSIAIHIGDDGHTLGAVDRATDRPLWSATYLGSVVRHEIATWNEQHVVLVGLGAAATDVAGAFLVYHLIDGTPLLADFPGERARHEYVRLMGYSGSEVTMLWQRYPVPATPRHFADLDGDGSDELLVPFAHQYHDRPAQLRVYRPDGTLRGSFYVTGTLNYHLAGDFDGDGKDEVLLSATSGDPARRGFSLILLDDEHLQGVSPDGPANPRCTLANGCLRAVTFPAFDDASMRELGGLRLMAWETLFLPDGADGIRFLAWIGVDPDFPLLLYLDAELRPVSVTPSDAFRKLLASAPQARDHLLNGHLADWVQRYELFPVETIAASTPDDAPLD